MEGFLLWQRNLLGVESLQVWHLAFQLCEVHLCIYLIGKEDRFLLVNSLLAGRDLDEEVAARDGRSGRAHMRLVVAVLSVHVGSAVGALCMSRHLNLHGA